LLSAALTGKLAKVKYYKDPVFGFEVPKTCPDVPESVLEPWSSWPSRVEYDKKYHDLAQRFAENFKKFEDGTPSEVLEAGPKV
jgi:phosphoenolpyruvate carboxykinase (ATP)